MMFRFVYFVAVVFLVSVICLPVAAPAARAVRHLPADTFHADVRGPFKGEFAEIRVDGKSRYVHRSGKVAVDKPEY